MKQFYKKKCRMAIQVVAKFKKCIDIKWVLRSTGKHKNSNVRK